MGDKKYVPDGSWLRCDKGALPQQLKVTHHNNTQIYGSPLASEADKEPFVNIPSLGFCQVSCSACVPAPIYWDKTARGVKVNGYKLLVDEAKLQCSLGGKVSVYFSRAEAMGGDNPLDYGPLGNGLFGVGLGTEFGQNYLGNQFGELAAQTRPFANSMVGLTPDQINALPSGQRGNFGEMRATADLRMRGYDVISNTQGGAINQNGHQGLDLAARDPHGPTDIVADAKMKADPTKSPSMGYTKRSGRQMSDRWLLDPTENRLGRAMSPADAARIDGKIRSGSPDLLRLAAKVNPDGSVSYYDINSRGGTGARSLTDLPPANVVSGSSRASNFINNASRSIQSTRTVSGANQWLVRNANTVARAGKVLGRVTLVLGIAADTYNIYQSYKADGNQVGTNTKQAIGTAVGGMAGAWGGAQLGATIGAVGGPVGIIVGGVVGGIIGGLAGGWLGGKIGSWF
ncbi:DUF4280 domain-containing protein [Fibrella sp. HMF5335]|uniref:DUF4280 domain-containing protein n=1 Tax=Fibrella rubiginis TaxID=2817060 RepID=A0A939GB66_9BACT|nr:PAAR-like protein [Fibrella rubiginis]MBO0935659.1 DUF4280 domain-containing protein [Fibrella rubiginis]